MHPESLEKMAYFAREVLTPYRDDALHILDFGSQTVDDQGISYRPLFEMPTWVYRGLDVAPGANVDVVVPNPFLWDEVVDDSVDVVISGQALEHVDFFWLSAFEIARVLRPGGVACLIVPSAGPQHSYPLDCWRYYTDGLIALCRYLEFDLLDAFTEWGRGIWADSMLLMRKPVWDDGGRRRFRERMAHQRAVLDPNGYVPGDDRDGDLPAVSPLVSLPAGTLAALRPPAAPLLLAADIPGPASLEERLLALAEARSLTRYVEITEDGVGPQVTEAFADSRHRSLGALSTLGDEPADLVFVRGLHRAEDACRAVEATWASATPDAVWVIDNTLPNSAVSAVPDVARHHRLRERLGIADMSWHGDVYRAVGMLGRLHPELQYVTITDAGNPQTLMWRSAGDDLAPGAESLADWARMDFLDLMDDVDRLLNCTTWQGALRLIARTRSTPPSTGNPP